MKTGFGRIVSDFRVGTLEEARLSAKPLLLLISWVALINLLNFFVPPLTHTKMIVSTSYLSTSTSFLMYLWDALCKN